MSLTATHPLFCWDRASLQIRGLVQEGAVVPIGTVAATIIILFAIPIIFLNMLFILKWKPSNTFENNMLSTCPALLNYTVLSVHISHLFSDLESLRKLLLFPKESI